MKKIFVLFIGILLATLSMYAKELSVPLKKWQEYEDAKPALLKAGWKPVVFENVIYGMPEIEYCQQGAGHCGMWLTDGKGKYLAITTTNDGYAIVNWKIKDSYPANAITSLKNLDDKQKEPSLKTLFNKFATDLIDSIPNASNNSEIGFKGIYLRSDFQSSCKKLQSMLKDISTEKFEYTNDSCGNSKGKLTSSDKKTVEGMELSYLIFGYKKEPEIKEMAQLMVDKVPWLDGRLEQEGINIAFLGTIATFKKRDLKRGFEFKMSNLTAIKVNLTQLEIEKPTF